MIVSSVLARVGRRAMGLYEIGSEGSLLGFGMGMIFACFQVWGMSPVVQI